MLRAIALALRARLHSQPLMLLTAARYRACIRSRSWSGGRYKGTLETKPRKLGFNTIYQ
jgi:hypothetical protein